MTLCAQCKPRQVGRRPERGMGFQPMSHRQDAHATDKAGLSRCLLLFLMAFGAGAFAQTPTPAPPPDLHNIWRCDLPGGTYEVGLRAIVSVSSHEYVVDGVARVTEVNVDTQGNMAVRFYCIEPNTPKTPNGIGQSVLDRVTDLGKEAAERVGADDIWKRVVKSYPGATHAHTVEYRVGNTDQLKKIFSSVQTAFETGRGSSLKLGADQ